MIHKRLARRTCAILLTCLMSYGFTTVSQADETGANADDSADEGKIAVPLSGTAMLERVENLSASPVRFNTGMVEVGSSSFEQIRLEHLGDPASDPININAARLFGENAAEFSTGFSGFTALSPGQFITIDVLFTPIAPGDKSAGLRLEVEGATAPYVLLFEGQSRYPQTSNLAISRGVINFGEAVTGNTKSETVQLSNGGGDSAPSITVSAATLSGDTPDDFQFDFTPTVLAPGQQMQLTIVMDSNQTGTKRAELTFQHDANNETNSLSLQGTVVNPTAIPVQFGKSTLNTTQNIDKGSSIQFGPDDKLYVSEARGAIHVFNVTRNGKNNYSANKLETINLVKNVQNHNDDGSIKNGLNGRTVTGFTVVGTAQNPIIYVASSDPRWEAGPSGKDTSLDTNSGILHKLSKNGGGWVKQDLVRGLPRSEENHVANGIKLQGNKILLLIGGNTNQGLPSFNFNEIPEYALSAALLEIDLGAIGSGTYDLPTLDDEDRTGVNDANDPFGGNNGKNMAKLTANGPVKLYATGLRNAYDLVITESGKIYTTDNGPNTGWGGTPGANCLNVIDNGGSKFQDGLLLLKKGAYYGHPNPTRGNKSNTFNASNPQSPIETAARPAECQFKQPGQDGALTTNNASTNGIDEYTASNFGGAMQGNLISAAFGKQIFRFQLNGAGTNLTSKSQLMTNVGQTPLDLTTQGDGEVFPGTIWITDLGASKVIVLEPEDY